VCSFHIDYYVTGNVDVSSLNSLQKWGFHEVADLLQWPQTVTWSYQHQNPTWEGENSSVAIQKEISSHFIMRVQTLMDKQKKAINFVAFLTVCILHYWTMPWIYALVCYESRNWMMLHFECKHKQVVSLQGWPLFQPHHAYGWGLILLQGHLSHLLLLLATKVQNIQRITFISTRD